MTEPAPESPWTRLVAYVRKHRSRLARVAVLAVTLYAVLDLLGSAPQDATLELPLDALRREQRAAGELERGDELEITVRAHGDTEPLTHTRVRVAHDEHTVRHAVHLAPGDYDVLAEMRGAVPREARFEIPAEGVVRVQWAEAP